MMVPTDDNDVVRYLMDEMDPSEEVLMERAMMEDDDLLIEVESMRQTLHRLDDMPEREPPAELSETIVKQAGEYRKHVKRLPTIPTSFYKYAAVLIIGIGLGSGLLYLVGVSSQGNGTTQQVAIIKSSAQNMAKLQVKPWVNQNNILYFQDKFGNNAKYQAIQQTSLHKLTPVKQPMLLGPSTTGGIHLAREIRR